MEPRHARITLPERDLQWVRGEEWEGRCDEVARDKWVRRPSKSADILIFADGPQGSGQFWNVTIGLAGGNDPAPKRGACLTTSTAGARTLAAEGRRALRFFDGAASLLVMDLPWIDDLDADGWAEVILWDSFPLTPDAGVAEQGLAAWVYRFAPPSAFEIDWSSSRNVAREIAAAYRASLDQRPEPGRVEGALWNAAADALQAFAAGSCTTAAGR
jgi:hypothetical protein